MPVALARSSSTGALEAKGESSHRTFRTGRAGRPEGPSGCCFGGADEPGRRFNLFKGLRRHFRAALSAGTAGEELPALAEEQRKASRLEACFERAEAGRAARTGKSRHGINLFNGLRPICGDRSGQTGCCGTRIKDRARRNGFAAPSTRRNHHVYYRGVGAACRWPQFLCSNGGAFVKRWRSLRRRKAARAEP